MYVARSWPEKKVTFSITRVSEAVQTTFFQIVHLFLKQLTTMQVKITALHQGTICTRPSLHYELGGVDSVNDRVHLMTIGQISSFSFFFFVITLRHIILDRSGGSARRKGQIKRCSRLAVITPGSWSYRPTLAHQFCHRICLSSKSFPEPTAASPFPRPHLILITPSRFQTFLICTSYANLTCSLLDLTLTFILHHLLLSGHRIALTLFSLPSSFQSVDTAPLRRQATCPRPSQRRPTHIKNTNHTTHTGQQGRQHHRKGTSCRTWYRWQNRCDKRADVNT